MKLGDLDVLRMQADRIQELEASLSEARAECERLRTIHEDCILRDGACDECDHFNGKGCAALVSPNAQQEPSDAGIYHDPDAFEYHTGVSNHSQPGSYRWSK